jgi:hypothetical protein
VDFYNETVSADTLSKQSDIQRKKIPSISDTIYFLKTSNYIDSSKIKEAIESEKSFPSQCFNNKSPDKEIFQGSSIGRPIPFERKLASNIRDYLIGVYENNLLFEIVPKYLTNILGNELKRFMCALEAYKRSSNPVIPLIELIEGVTDIEYSSYLKRVRRKSWLKTSRLRLVEDDESLENIPEYRINDIGDIFNYNYFFRWEEEAEDDYLWGFVPVEQISEEDKMVYKSVLANLLPKNIRVIKEEEILITNSNSSSLNADYTTSEKFKNKEKSNCFSKEPLLGKRCNVYVGPQNTRDTIILSVEQSNTISLIDTQCREIVENLKYSLHISDPERFESKLNKFRYDFSEYLDRDIKKEGITKNRELVMMTLEVLSDLYPECPAWSYSNIYSDYFLIVDGEKLNPPRGHGLGMANSLTTIIQCTLFDIIKDYAVSEEGIQRDSISAIFLNDDCTIGGKTEDDIIAVDNWDSVILERYGVIRNNKKTSIGIYTVFCEIYSSCNSKESYKLYELYSIFSSTNIVDAKWRFSNIPDFVNPEDLENYWEEITDFFGYEFFPDEYKVSSLFGGWLAPTYNGVRLDFINVNLTYEMTEAFYAVNRHNKLLKRTRVKDRIYIDPIAQLYGKYLLLPEEAREALNYLQSYKKVVGDMERWKTRQGLERAWLSLERKRKQTFKKKAHFQNIKEIYKQTLNMFPNKDFYPPDDIIIRIEKLIPGIEEIPIHTSINKTLSYIKYYDSEGVIDVEPERRSYLLPRNTKRLTSAERKKIFRFNCLSKDNFFYTDSYYYYPENPELLDYRMYLTPNKVAAVTASLYGYYGIPIVEEDIEMHEKISEKEVEILKDLSYMPISRYRIIAKHGFKDLWRVRKGITAEDWIALSKPYKKKREKRKIFELKDLTNRQDLIREFNEIKEKMVEPESPSLLFNYFNDRGRTDLVWNELQEGACSAISMYLWNDNPPDSLTEKRPRAEWIQSWADEYRPYIELATAIWVHSGGTLAPDGYMTTLIPSDDENSVSDDDVFNLW